MSESPILAENSPQPISIAEAAVQHPPPGKRMTLQLVLMLCSLSLIGLFFVPWISTILGSASGYDIQKTGSDGSAFLWFIPLGGAFAFLALLVNKLQVSASRIAGAIPFAALVFYRIKIGGELFSLLNGGAYCVLFAGAVLLVFPQFLSKPTTSKP